MRLAANSRCHQFVDWRAYVGQSILRCEMRASLVRIGTRQFSYQVVTNSGLERINRDGLVKCFPDTFDYVKDILNAQVYDVCKKTDLTYAPKLSQKTGNRVLLKREDQQPVHSFKLRGAYNMMVQLSAEEKSRGIVAVSAGNHAQGVAFAASEMQISAKIFMPKIAPTIKVEAVRARAGEFTEVILEGSNYDECYAAMMKCKEEEGRVVVHPFNDPKVIAGQGTIGQEIISQTTGQEINAVFGCVGGGGLIAGMGLFVKAVKPSIKVIGVEAEDAASMTESLRAGKLVTLPSVGLFADGAAVATVGDESFRLAQMVVDEMMTVTTDEICAAIKDTFLDTRVVLEPAGALAVAGLTKYSALMEKKGQTLVAVTSGANMDFDRLRFVSERADTSETLIVVQIPERPSSLKEMYRHICPRNVTEFSYRISDDPAFIYMSFQAESNEDRDVVLRLLNDDGFRPKVLNDNELAKTHGRHLVGGRAPARMTENEVLFRFIFPDKPGMLLRFLEALPTTVNISLFHYRSHGADQARVLVAFQVPASNRMQLREYLNSLKNQGFAWVEETENDIYGNFLLEPVTANVSGRSRPRQPPPLTLTSVDGV